MSDVVDLSALRGRSVMVLGGASGLGLAIAKRFARTGAHVTIADLDIKGGTSAAKDFQAQGMSATFVRCDMTDHSSSVQAFEHALQTSPNGSIDVTALIAGVIGGGGKPRRQGPWISTQELSLPTRATPSGFGRQPSGSVPVCVPGLVVYDDGPAWVWPTDKRRGLLQVTDLVGVRGLFRGLRHETPRLNIRTNCLAPYFMRTPMVENALETFAAAGMEPGKGITFVDLEAVVEVAGRFAVDGSLHGRAVAILPDPEGAVDLKDDEEGLWAGEVFKMVQDKRRVVGDII